jgi:hypothetical protein
LRICVQLYTNHDLRIQRCVGILDSWSRGRPSQPPGIGLGRSPKCLAGHGVSGASGPLPRERPRENPILFAQQTRVSAQGTRVGVHPRDGACDPGPGGLTLDKDECSPSLVKGGRVYPLVNQGRVKILPCPGEILPCQGKAFILVKEDRPP